MLDQFGHRFTFRLFLRWSLKYSPIACIAILAGFSFGCATAPKATIDAPEFDKDVAYARAMEKVEILQQRTNDQNYSYEYRIHPTDVIEVNVFDYEKMNLLTRVGLDGFINFPPLGQIQAGGRTQNELTQDLVNKLQGDYLKNPQIVVFVRESTAQSVIVIGEVKLPGLQAVWGQVRLLDVLAKAGGLTETAGQIAYITPADSTGLSGYTETSSDTIEQQPHADLPNHTGAIEVYLTDLLLAGDQNWNILLNPGDTVIIPAAGSVHITGSGVETPGTYPLSFRTTTARQIIDEATGLKPYAQRTMTLARKRQDGGSDYYKVDLNKMIKDINYDVVMQPDDRLIVDTSRSRYALNILNALLLNAVFQWHQDPDWSLLVGGDARYAR